MVLLYKSFFPEARAHIAGPRNKEVHVRRRSEVSLKCVVDLGLGREGAAGGQNDAVAVFWYLDGRALDWLGQTGPGRGVQVNISFSIENRPFYVCYLRSR
jgi:hypothetical protein